MQNSLPFPSRLIKDQLKIRHNKMDIELTVVLENTAQMNSRNAEALQYFTFIRQPCTQSLPQPVQHRVPGPPLSPHLGQWRGSSFCRQAVLKGHSEVPTAPHYLLDQTFLLPGKGVREEEVCFRRPGHRGSLHLIFLFQ